MVEIATEAGTEAETREVPNVAEGTTRGGAAADEAAVQTTRHTGKTTTVINGAAAAEAAGLGVTTLPGLLLRGGGDTAAGVGAEGAVEGSRPTTIPRTRIFAPRL